MQWSRGHGRGAVEMRPWGPCKPPFHSLVHSFVHSFTPPLTLRIFAEEQLSAGTLPSPRQGRGAKPANPGRVTGGGDRRRHVGQGTTRCRVRKCPGGSRARVT